MDTVRLDDGLFRTRTVNGLTVLSEKLPGVRSGSCEDEMRLACQTTVNGDIEVETQPPVRITGEKFWE